MSESPAPGRDDVLRVAEELLAAEGPGGLSVRRIADRLGVSRQIVYSRFTGKPDLVRALHSLGFERLTAAFAGVDEEPGTRAHVLAMAHAYRDCALAQPALYELMFGAPVAEFAPDASARRVAGASFRPVVDAAVAWLENDGRGTTDASPLVLAQMLWSATHGVVALELAGLVGREAPELVERLTLAAIAGTVAG